MDAHDWARQKDCAEQLEAAGDFQQASFAWFAALQEANAFAYTDDRTLITLSRFARCCYIQGRFEMSETLFTHLNALLRSKRSSINTNTSNCSETLNFSTPSTDSNPNVHRELSLLSLGGLALSAHRLSKSAQCQSYLESLIRALECETTSNSYLVSALHCLSVVLHSRLKSDKAELAYLRAIEVARRMGVIGAQKIRFVAQDQDALAKGLMPTELALIDLETWILKNLQDFSALHETFTSESRDLHMAASIFVVSKPPGLLHSPRTRP